MMSRGCRAAVQNGCLRSQAGRSGQGPGSFLAPANVTPGRAGRRACPVLGGGPHPLTTAHRASKAQGQKATQPAVEDRRAGRAHPSRSRSRSGESLAVGAWSTVAQAARGISTPWAAGLAAFTPGAYRRGGLPRPFNKGNRHLGRGLALRCFQRLSLPDVAARRCA